MSKYCGKCDFRDCLEIYYKDDFEEFKKHATVKDYDGNIITFNCPADLIPYYTYIVGMSGGSKEPDGSYKWTAFLSKEDYLDSRIKDRKAYNEWAKENDLDLLSFDYLYELKENLKNLYEEERNKPYGEQKII